MKRVSQFWLPAILFLLLVQLLSGIFSGSVYAAQTLPALIQTTTLEEDYRAMTSLGLSATPRMDERDAAQAFENVLCSCVRIQVEGHYGSGSIIRMLEDEIIIVTNRHVLQYWNEDSYVTFFNGAVHTGHLLGMSEQADVGFISIPVSDFTCEELLQYRNVRLPDAAPKAAGQEKKNGSPQQAESGEPLFFVDLASDWKNPVMLEGELLEASAYLEDFQTEMLYGTGNAVPGMSGCGVFDGYGNYLGMMTGGTLEGEIAAVPAEMIEEILKTRLT